jgi:aryl-alcohol dehydrogenase-like predicted oxidoreductase
VQFGLPYGIANTDGQVSVDAAAAILADARRLGVATLDTAIDYGESEARLGSIGVRDWAVNSKLPAIPESCPDVDAWVVDQVAGSLARLRVERLNALLLHRPQQLLGPRGAALYRALAALKARGWVARIGVSVYAPAELEALCGRFRLDVVQAPLNVIDRSLVTSGWVERLQAAGIEVQVRSIFLQGLLLMQQRPAYFDRWEPLWRRWGDWLERSALTPLEACLGHVASVRGLDRIVIGVDSRAQLAQIAAALRTRVAEAPPELASDDPALIHPAQWQVGR